MHAEPRIVALGPHDGTTMGNPVGGLLTFKARALETGGAMTVLESEVPPGEGPAEHVHGHEDEAIYVLAGELCFRLGEYLHRGAAGSFVFIPRGTPHCFQNVGSTGARILVIFTPCGMERFFEHMESTGAAFAEAAGEVGMTVVGPPLRTAGP
jgi:quercetin dioxygenase-like cupin family protein